MFEPAVVAQLIQHAFGASGPGARVQDLAALWSAGQRPRLSSVPDALKGSIYTALQGRIDSLPACFLRGSPGVPCQQPPAQ
jgi:hypothetical protein